MSTVNLQWRLTQIILQIKKMIFLLIYKKKFTQLFKEELKKELMKKSIILNFK